MDTRYINQPRNTNTFKDNREGSFWHEMKPFVKFGFKALGLMATALIAIVKAIPKPGDGKPAQSSKIINIDR